MYARTRDKTFICMIFDETNWSNTFHVVCSLDEYSSFCSFYASLFLWFSDADAVVDDEHGKHEAFIK